MAPGGSAELLVCCRHLDLASADPVRTIHCAVTNTKDEATPEGPQSRKNRKPKDETSVLCPAILVSRQPTEIKLTVTWCLALCKLKLIFLSQESYVEIQYYGRVSLSLSSSDHGISVQPHNPVQNCL